MKIGTILDQVDLGSIALPEFQRGFVWNRDQVRGLMDSLYRKHPVGSLLVWVTSTGSAKAWGDGKLAPGVVNLLLDGQQRITSLYGIIRGKTPRFFRGMDPQFDKLYFNLEEESFRFYSPVDIKDNPLWVNVTELMQQDVGPFIVRLNQRPEFASKLAQYISRLSAITAIKEIDLYVEQVTGEDKTVDVVVDIFNKVNSGGTKLSKGDLALARVCAAWPEARQEMERRLEQWKGAGFYFRLDWLLRIINAIVTGEALFTALKDVDTADFREGLGQAENAVDALLNLIAGRLGLDHDEVLGSRYSFPLMARYLMQADGHLADYRERDKLLYWYVHSFLWGRYAGSTETVLNQDLHLIEKREGALERLIEALRQNRGDLRLSPNDFLGWSRGARLYPVLYMLTRVWHAQDWDSGVELKNQLLGYMNRLELHHIFPKGLLYKHGYGRAEVNALANFTFLTKATNLKVSDRDPAEYLAEFASRQPGALESTWIPMDAKLWQVKNYRDFLAARRELLAKAANEFLNSLYAGAVPEVPMISVLESAVTAIPGGVVSDEEERVIAECNQWVMDLALPEGERNYELADPVTGEVQAILDLAWPNGLQEGLSQRVALLIDESPEVEAAVNRAGYRHFEDVEAFKEYVRREILAVVPVAA
ncbi:MAG: GmrSD restriction endonuclease domain-containing protein [Anaerolineae bacterium]